MPYLCWRVFFFPPPKILNRRVYSTTRHSPLISLKTPAHPILVFGIPPVYRHLRNCVIDSNMVAGLVVNSPSTYKLVIELNVLGELATRWKNFVFLSPFLNQSTLNLSPTNLLQDSCLFELNLMPILIKFLLNCQKSSFPNVVQLIKVMPQIISLKLHIPKFFLIPFTKLSVYLPMWNLENLETGRTPTTFWEIGSEISFFFPSLKWSGLSQMLFQP